MKNRLKELRKLYRWSQADLARKLEISRQAVNGFESGKFDPSLDMAFKIASLLNVAIEDVFINEAKNSMQTLVKQVKNYFGFEFGFERFNPKAINVINFARNEAVSQGSSQVEPEHLLTGLLADPTTTSARLLKGNGVKQNIEIDEHSLENSHKLKLSSSSKFVLELALQVVRLQDKKSIGTEHLLWGLVRLLETNTTASNNLFQQYEVDKKTLNDQLTEII
ncbi:MAG: helix-turn-helix domain-containing protein [Cyanobacteria bacterium P01_G01_bin.39]